MSSWIEPRNSVHLFEADPEVFRAVTTGLQQVLVDQDELDVRSGDQVILRELGSKRQYTGQWLCRRVTHRLPGGAGSGIAIGHGVLSLNNAAENEYATAHLRKDLGRAAAEGVSAGVFFERLAASERVERSRRQGLLLERVS